VSGKIRFWKYLSDLLNFIHPQHNTLQKFFNLFFNALSVGLLQQSDIQNFIANVVVIYKKSKHFSFIFIFVILQVRVEKGETRIFLSHTCYLC